MNDLLSQLDKVLTLSTAAMVFALCIICGYVLRLIKRFPNDAIPLAAILIGGLAMVLLSEQKAGDMPVRILVTRQIIAGLIIGFIAWISHKLILGKIEDYLGTKFEFVGKLLNVDSKPNENDTPPPPAP